MTDDLHGHQPLCELLQEHELHFIMTCKTDSHKALYQEVELLTRVEDAVHTKTTRHWNGRYHEPWVYRCLEQEPIKAGAKAVRVNWREITIVQENTGKQICHNAWITSHELTPETVPEACSCGPCPLEGREREL